MKNGTMGHAHPSPCSVEAHIWHVSFAESSSLSESWLSQVPDWGTAVLRHSTSRSTVYNKAQHCRFFSEMTVSAVLQVLTQSHWCSALRKGQVTRNPSLCLLVPTEWLWWLSRGQGPGCGPFQGHLAWCSHSDLQQLWWLQLLVRHPGLRMSSSPCSSHFSSVPLQQSCEGGDTRRIKELREEKETQWHVTSHCSPVLDGNVFPINSIEKYRGQCRHSHTYLQV